MVFSFDAISEVKEFENSLIQAIKQSDWYNSISIECKKKKMNILAKIEIDGNTNYHSSVNIAILDENGILIKENDEPNCSLFIYETVCYSRKNKIVAVDLLSESDFIQQEKELLNTIKTLK